MLRFLEGVDILKKYKEPENYGMCAQHDIVYTCFDTPPDQLSEEDRQRLEDLTGWHWNTDEDECWAYFT